MSPVKAWILASRPKTLTGAAAPVLIGGAMAFRAGYTDVILPFILCLLFAFFMQIDANLINDYFDFKKGTDREDRLGPERACAQGWITPSAMKIGIIITTVVSCLIGIGILLCNMQWELIVVGILCVVFCFLYTTKLSYLGFGDLLVLIFFGIVPVGFTYYVMTIGEWTLSLTFAGLAMGLATDNLLMVNNYRDRNQDAISGKRTIVVRTIASKGKKEGEEICLDMYLWIGIFATILGFTALFLFPYSSIRFPLILVYLILHFKSFQRIKSLDGKELNQVLGETARNIFLFGLLLSISCFL